MKTRNTILLIALIILLSAVFFIYLNQNKREDIAPALGTQIKNSTTTTASLLPNSTLLTITDNQGEVAVEVKPIKINNSAPWQFNIALNTHSTDLDDDLMTQATLYDDSSRSYQPTNWNGSPPGGHHRSGVLSFNPINPKPKYIELKIKNIGEISLRVFKWNLP